MQFLTPHITKGRELGQLDAVFRVFVTLWIDGVPGRQQSELELESSYHRGKIVGRAAYQQIRNP